LFRVCHEVGASQRHVAAGQLERLAIRKPTARSIHLDRRRRNRLRQKANADGAPAESSLESWSFAEKRSSAAAKPR